MGLDWVELILSVEESFGIHIPDADAQHLSTLRKLSAYVEQRLGTRQTSPCLSQRAFYRVHQGLLNTGPLTKNEVRPATRLEHLLQVATRRDQWHRLEQAVELPFPELVHSPWLILTGCLGTGGISTLLGLGVLVTTSRIASEVYLALGSVAIVLLWIGLFVAFERTMRQRATRFQMATVGELATHLAHHHSRLLLGPDEGWTPDQIYETVAALLYEVSGLEHADPDADFRRDLGIE